MKKGISLFCILILFLVAQSSLFAGASLEVTPHNVKVQPGAEFTVNIDLDTDTSIMSLMAILQWDDSVIEPVEYIVPTEFDDPDNISTGWIENSSMAIVGVAKMFANAIVAPYDGTIAQIKFKAKVDAEVGDATLVYLSLDSTLYQAADIAVQTVDMDPVLTTLTDAEVTIAKLFSVSIADKEVNYDAQDSEASDAAVYTTETGAAYPAGGYLTKIDGVELENGEYDAAKHGNFSIVGNTIVWNSSTFDTAVGHTPLIFTVSYTANSADGKYSASGVYTLTVNPIFPTPYEIKVERIFCSVGSNTATMRVLMKNEMPVYKMKVNISLSQVPFITSASGNYSATIQAQKQPGCTQNFLYNAGTKLAVLNLSQNDAGGPIAASDVFVEIASMEFMLDSTAVTDFNDYAITVTPQKINGANWEIYDTTQGKKSSIDPTNDAIVWGLNSLFSIGYFINVAIAENTVEYDAQASVASAEAVFTDNDGGAYAAGGVLTSIDEVELIAGEYDAAKHGTFSIVGNTIVWNPATFDRAVVKHNSLTFNVSYSAESNDDKFPASGVYTLTVNPVNQSPVLSDFTVIAAIEGGPMQFSVRIFDPEGDAFDLPTVFEANIGESVFNLEGTWTNDGNTYSFTTDDTIPYDAVTHTDSDVWNVLESVSGEKCYYASWSTMLVATDEFGAEGSFEAGSIPYEFNTWFKDTDRPQTAPTFTAYTPAVPTTNDDINVVFGLATDEDSDTITYEVVWSRGSVGYGGMTLSASQTRKGETWQATIYATTRPYGAAISVTTEAVGDFITIRNTAPTLFAKATLSIEGSVEGYNESPLVFSIANTKFDSLEAFKAAAGEDDTLLAAYYDVDEASEADSVAITIDGSNIASYATIGYSDGKLTIARIANKSTIGLDTLPSFKVIATDESGDAVETEIFVEIQPVNTKPVFEVQDIAILPTDLDGTVKSVTIAMVSMGVCDYEEDQRILQVNLVSCEWEGFLATDPVFEISEDGKSFNICYTMDRNVANYAEMEMVITVKDDGGLPYQDTSDEATIKFVYDNIPVAFDIKGEEVVVTGLSEIYKENDKLEIPDEIRHLPVTTIAEGAFEGNESLVEVTIPDSVTTIGEGAFADCSSLSNITLSENLQTLPNGVFALNTSLKFVSIPDSVTAIGKKVYGEAEGAFAGCNNLTTIVIGNGVTSIAGNAFDGCDSLAIIYTDNLFIMPRLRELLGRKVAIRPVPTPFRVTLQTEYGFGTRGFENNDELIFGLEEQTLTKAAIPNGPAYSLAFTDGGASLSTDIRFFAEKATWIITAQLSPRTSLKLNWAKSASGDDDTYAMPEEFQFTLAVDGVEPLDMREITSYTLENINGMGFKTFTLALTVERARTASCSVTYELFPGWNLIGIPFDLDSESVESLQSLTPMGYDAESQCYYYTDLEYAPGSALWVFVSETTLLTVYGTPVESRGVALRKGWNMVTPLYGEDGSAVANPGLEEAWYWNSTGNKHLLPEEDAIPGVGYWLYSDKDQVIWDK